MTRKAFAFWLILASPALAGDLAFVTSQNADRVSVIDLNRTEVLAETSLAGAPAPVAYDPRMARAYVIAADTGRLSVLDETGAILTGRDLGEGAFGLAIAPDGGVFVGDWFGGRLLRLDSGLKTLWTAKTGKAPAGIAVDDDALIVATADRDDNVVSIFDARNGQFLRRVATGGAHPFGLTFHDGRLWSADVQGNSVSVIDPSSGRLLGQIRTGSHPYAIAFAAGRGFVTNQYAGSLTVFDPGSFKVLGEIAVGDYPEGIAALPDGTGVAVANWDSDTLTIVDAESLRIRAELDLPAGPRAFGSFTGRQVRP